MTERKRFYIVAGGIAEKVVDVQGTQARYSFPGIKGTVTEEYVLRMREEFIRSIGEKYKEFSAQESAQEREKKKNEEQTISDKIRDALDVEGTNGTIR